MKCTVLFLDEQLDEHIHGADILNIYSSVYRVDQSKYMERNTVLYTGLTKAGFNSCNDAHNVVYSGTKTRPFFFRKTMENLLVCD